VVAPEAKATIAWKIAKAMGKMMLDEMAEARCPAAAVKMTTTILTIPAARVEIQRHDIEQKGMIMCSASKKHSGKGAQGSGSGSGVMIDMKMTGRGEKDSL